MKWLLFGVVWFAVGVPFAIGFCLAARNTDVSELSDTTPLREQEAS